MLHTTTLERRGWWHSLLNWWHRLRPPFLASKKTRSTPAPLPRRFPIPPGRAHLYARAADEFI